MDGVVVSKQLGQQVQIYADLIGESAANVIERALREWLAQARVCANPDCAAPYFLAKRKDTKLCGSEACAAWAQRQWSLAWWNKRGSKLRKLRGSAK